MGDLAADEPRQKTYGEYAADDGRAPAERSPFVCDPQNIGKRLPISVVGPQLEGEAVGQESSGRVSSIGTAGRDCPSAIGSSAIGLGSDSGTMRMVAVALRGDQPAGGLNGRSGVPGR